MFSSDSWVILLFLNGSMYILFPGVLQQMSVDYSDNNNNIIILVRDQCVEINLLGNDTHHRSTVIQPF